MLVWICLLIGVLIEAIIEIVVEVTLNVKCNVSTLGADEGIRCATFDQCTSSIGLVIPDPVVDRVRRLRQLESRRGHQS